LGVAKSNTSTDDVQWLALAVPSLGAAATWIIFIQDAYIYSLIDFLAACESTVPKSEPDLRYNIGRWMAGDMKRQWWWQYAILAVIIIGLNFVTFLVAGLSCIGLAFIVIGTALSATAILLSIRWGHSTQQSVDYFRQWPCAWREVFGDTSSRLLTGFFVPDPPCSPSTHLQVASLTVCPLSAKSLAC
jgi:hypothetical protein